MEKIRKRAQRRSEQEQAELDQIISRAEQTRIMQGLYEGKPLFGSEGVFTDLLQRMVNATLQGELDAFMKGQSRVSGNRRNGVKEKQVRSTGGMLTVRTPRDREGEFEPQLIKNWERELTTGMDEIILSLYAKGHSVEDVQQHIREIYGVELSHSVITAITNRILPEISEWQNRPLHSCYPVLYLDGIYYKVRINGTFVTKVIYTCYGVGADGIRDVLGLYSSESESASAWGNVLEDLKRRGVEDVLIFCIDGVKGLREAIETVFPEATVQRCIVHMVRSSTQYVKDKDMHEVCADLKQIYQSATLDSAMIALETFRQKWDKYYPSIADKWEKEWDSLMAFMDYTTDIRRLIYTTNPVEAVHRVMRKVTKSKGAWISESALMKQLYLTLMHNKKSWNKNVFNWKSVQNELIEKYGERYSKHLI